MKIKLSPDMEVNLDQVLHFLGCKNHDGATKDFLRIALENVVLFDKKHSDYGPGNIADFMQIGVIIRMSDKMNRVKNLIAKKRRSSVREPITDSMQDISNYANIYQMLERNLWPTQKSQTVPDAKASGLQSNTTESTTSIPSSATTVTSKAQSPPAKRPQSAAGTT